MNFINKWVIFSAIITCVSFNNIIPQSSIPPVDRSDFKFDEIGLRQGLSQSTVNSIAQDKQGFMWFGTQDGLNRYDDYSFLLFKYNPSDSNSLSENNIYSLINDRKGDLWIGTRYGGVDRYVISENKFYHYKHKEGDLTSISNNFITAIFEDSKGIIWLGTINGLNMFNRKTNSFTHFLSNIKDSTSINSNDVWSICEDSSNNLWIGTSLGLCKVEKNAQGKIHFKRYDIIKSQSGKGTNLNIVALNSDNHGKIWLGTWGTGLISFDQKTLAFEHYLHSEKNKLSISSNFIRSIFNDSEGRLWVATNEAGLNMFDRKNFSFLQITDDAVQSFYEDKSGIVWMGTFISGVKAYNNSKNLFKHYFNDPKHPNGLQSNNITALFMDSDGELWVGTYDYGVSRFNKLRNNITNYNLNQKKFNTISSNRIFAICESPGGNIWIGTDKGLNLFNKKTNKFVHYTYNKFNNNTISNDKISALCTDRNGDIWIGNLSCGIDLFLYTQNKFVHYLPNQKIPNSIKGTTITKIYQDSGGIIWVGTMDGGLFRYIPGNDSKKETGSFEYYKTNLKTDKGLNKSSVLAIYEDKENILWIGTDGGGLNRYDIRNNSFKYYTKEQGLPNDIIYAILPDKSGNIWLSTNNGISRFNPDRETFKNFNEMDGLQANEFNQGSYCQNSDGELLFGGVNGFSAFFPENIRDNQYVPPVYVTSFKVFNKDLILQSTITSVKNITLSYSQNFFSFEFAALNYTSPYKNQYAYMLEGFDNNWYKVSALQRYGSYTNLDPGKYVLHVKGSNNDGVWNDKGTSIEIVVVPPYWMTWWFRLFFLLAVVSVASYIYHRRTLVLKQERSLQQEISSLLIKKQEEERTRIAQEMHDSLGQDLLFIKNRLLLTIQDTSDNSRITQNLNQISDDVSLALKSVREISHNLRPPDLDRLGLRETLISIIDVFRKSTKIKVKGEIDNINGLLNHELEINIVRIVQESLTNIFKHSGATDCNLLILNGSDTLRIEISDNGRGFEQSDILTGKMQPSGLGLISMAERVKILNGKLSINSSPGNGTKINISVPVTC